VLIAYLTSLQTCFWAYKICSFCGWRFYKSWFLRKAPPDLLLGLSDFIVVKPDFAGLWLLQKLLRSRLLVSASGF
jgi:hypothetical protein